MRYCCQVRILLDLASDFRREQMKIQKSVTFEDFGAYTTTNVNMIDVRNFKSLYIYFETLSYEIHLLYFIEKR